MKKSSRILEGILFLILSIFLIYSCKKDKPTPPIITTTAASAITQTTATSGGNITSDGGATVTARGVCWSTTTGPTTALSTKSTDNTGTGIFTSSITALTAGTVYYVRAYATNSAGTAYGNEISFTTTAATVPVLTTTAASAITQTTATSGGNITSDGGAAVTARGVCWSITTGPTTALSTKTTDGAGTGTFISTLAGLTGGTVYYVRAYATNITGTAYGNELNFTTIATLPTLTTTAASTIAQTTAISGGNITSDGGATVTVRGVCWSTSANPTTALTTKTSDGTGSDSFTSSLTGLTANTTYYVRAYATNSIGTAYGTQVSFTTSSGTVTDIEGNIYNTVTIGTQTWIVENLKTTKYNDGTAIPNVTDGTAWAELTTPSYCWYNNDGTTYKATYGALYNWYTVNSTSNGGKNVCPTSWHVPTDAEWTTLTTYLGGESFAGGKLKEIGTTHWTTPNTGATDETGFTALPGGNRYGSGACYYIGYDGFWWSSTEYSSTYAWSRDVVNDNADVYRVSNDRRDGFSVRCLKDN